MTYNEALNGKHEAAAIGVHLKSVEDHIAEFHASRMNQQRQERERLRRQYLQHLLTPMPEAVA